MLSALKTSFCPNDRLMYSMDYLALVEGFKAGVSIKNRKYLLKNFKQCFIGSEAVTWLIQHHWASTRSEAVTLGNLMLQNGVFQHVTAGHPFGDKYLFFKFTEEEEQKAGVFSFLLNYQFEDILQAVRHGTWTTSVRHKKTNSIFILQLFEGSFCDRTNQKNTIHLLTKTQENPHPNIVRIEEFVISKKYFSFLSPARQGFPLLLGLIRFQKKLGKENSHMIMTSLQEIMKQIISALNHLHSLGIALGRLIPSNILFSNDSEDDTSVSITGIGYAVASQYYKNIFIKDCNFLPPESNPLESPQIVTLDRMDSLLTSQERLMGVNPISFVPSDDAWSVGIILYIILYGETPFPCWDVRDRYDLIRNGIGPCCFKNANPDQHLATGHSLDLLTKLLHVNPKERLPLKEALQHPFFSQNPESFLATGKDWSKATIIISKRWNHIWKLFEGGTVEKNGFPGLKEKSLFYSPLLFPRLLPISLTLQSYLPDMKRKNIHRIGVIGIQPEHAPCLLYAIQHLGKSIPVPKVPSTNESYYTNNGTTFHFVESIPGDTKATLLPLPSLHHASCSVMVCYWDKDVKAGSIERYFRALFCPSSARHAEVSTVLPVVILLVGFDENLIEHLSISLESKNRAVSLLSVANDNDVGAALARSFLIPQPLYPIQSPNLPLLRVSESSLQLDGGNMGTPISISEKTFLTTLNHLIDTPSRWKCIDFRYCIFKRAHWDALMGALPLLLQNGLSTLQWIGCPLGDSKIEDVIMQLFKIKNSVSTLLFSASQMTYASASLLAHYIANQHSIALKTLDLSDNPLRDEGCHSLLTSLCVNKSITSLRMWNVSMGMDSAFVINELIIGNKNLTALDIRHNIISPSILVAFQRSLLLSLNTNIRSFLFSSSGLRGKQEKCIQQYIARNFDLYQNRSISLRSHSYKSAFEAEESSTMVVSFSLAERRLRDCPNSTFGGFDDDDVYSGYEYICYKTMPLTLAEFYTHPEHHVARLVLTSLQLTALPVLLQELPLLSLRELVLSNNLLSNYQGLHIETARHLISLDLSCNKLEGIPSLSHHKNLTILYLHGNVICETSGCKGLLSLSKLNVIHLSGNYINSFPLAELGNFSLLTEFEIHHNNMHVAKEAIYRAFFLKQTQLDLSGAGLSSLPNDFIYLHALRLVNLSRNQFVCAPPQLRHMKSLQIILMKENHFNDVSDLFLGNCTTSQIFVADNEFRKKRNAPSRITTLIRGNRTGEDISSFSNFDTRKNEVTKLVKIILVGQSNPVVDYISEHLHSSSLCHVASFSSAPPLQVCSCVTIHEKQEHISFTIHASSHIQLEMWKLCGAAKGAFPFYKNDAAIYSLFFDTSVLLEAQIRPELQLIQATCQHPFIILIGFQGESAIKLPPGSPSLEEQVEKLQEKGLAAIQYILLLNPSEQSLNQWIEYISKITTEDDEKQSKLALKMTMENHDLIRSIYNEKKYSLPPTLSYKDLSVMAKFCCLDEYANPKPIARYVSKTGRILFIDDQKMGLTDFIVLERCWAVNAWRELITAPTNNGFIPYDQLSMIWMSPCFPPHLVASLCNLLEKYEILTVMTLPGQPKALLVPSMFQPEKPLLIDVWEPLQDIVFSNGFWDSLQPEFGRVCSFMKAVPHNFMSRLILRLFHIGHPVRYWKRGILLEKHNNFCLVEQTNDHDISFLFRCYSMSIDHPSVIAPFIRLVMDCGKQLVSVYRAPCEFSVSFLSPAAGYDCRFSISESEIFESLTVGDTSIQKETCLSDAVPFTAIAPDLVLEDLCSFLIDDPLRLLMEKEGKEIAQGAFGTIFKGKYKGKVVAIKELKMETKDGMEAFCREVSMSACLKHPAIVEMFGFAWKPLLIVLEFIPHGDLFVFLHESPVVISWPLRLKIGRDIASAMEYLHSRDPVIIHRDLKTPNCLIHSLCPEEITVKVTDFGESVLLAQSYLGRDNLTNPVWMAPEILRNEEYDQKSDVYSFAIVLWELLLRKFPFDEFPVATGPFKSLLEDAIIDGLRPTIPSNTPNPYFSLVESCWNNNSEERPPFSAIVKEMDNMIQECSQWSSSDTYTLP